MVPVPFSITLSMKSMRPTWVKSGSSISFRRTTVEPPRAAMSSFLAAFAPTSGGDALVAKIGRLVEGEFEADRIDRHDGREQGRVAAGPAGHQIAERNAAVADAAGHRRAQIGEAEIEFGLADRGLLRRDIGFRDPLDLRALIEGLLGDGLVAHQRRGAIEIAFGESEFGAGSLQAWPWPDRARSGTAACRW